MKTLFGEEAKESPRAVKPAESKPSFAPPSSGPRLVAERLGVIDDVYECADTSCGSVCHDIFEENGNRWMVQCVFCGTSQSVEAIPGVIKQPEAAAEFRFAIAYGERFPGKTVEEVAEEKSGPQYISWAAANHPSPEAKDACKKYLDAKNASD